MKVLYTTDLSRPGNDVFINESVSLIEQFNMYVVIKLFRVTGWSEREDATILISTTDKDAAIKKYLNYGGTFN